MKRMLMTGASSGIGLELAKGLLEEGHQVIALTRSELPADPLLDRAREGRQLSIVAGDLADASSRARALAEIARVHDRLDGVFNVAGVSLGAPLLSPQGRDVHFEVNTLAPFVVLRELQHLLERGEDKVFVNVSSNAALTVNSFEPGSLTRPSTFKKLFGPYAQSKLALSLWTQAIAPQLAAAHLRIVSVCPGGSKTPMTAGPGMPWWLLPFRSFLFAPPQTGAATIRRAALDRSLAQSGAFIVKGKSTPLPFSERASEVLALVEAEAAKA